jgi:hypothetical protein
MKMPSVPRHGVTGTEGRLFSISELTRSAASLGQVGVRSLTGLVGVETLRGIARYEPVDIRRTRANFMTVEGRVQRRGRNVLDPLSVNAVVHSLHRIDVVLDSRVEAVQELKPLVDA